MKHWLHKEQTHLKNNIGRDNHSEEEGSASQTLGYDAGKIPDRLEHIPHGYEKPAQHAGKLVRLTYQTYESFSYEKKTHPIKKVAWVYEPYEYNQDHQYDILYLSHGGWSDETTLMGTPKNETSFKHAIDHGIEDGLIAPLIIVLLTYNNTSGKDSWDYSLALQLTNNFHNELVNDLMPAVESKWHTYAKEITPEGFAASRDHRGFAGFSMGSVNTWHTFQYCLDYFRWFMPMSGSYTNNASVMVQMVKNQDRGPRDFFIFSMSGTRDFAYSGIKNQIEAMEEDPSQMFQKTDSLEGGNIAFRARAGYEHTPNAADEYTYNGIRLFFNGAQHQKGAQDSSAQNTTEEKVYYSTRTPIKEVANDAAFGDWGKFIFPLNKGYMSGKTLGSIGLTWYSEIDPNETVTICNYLRNQAERGHAPFIRFYSDEDIKRNPNKANTGLFFFRGKPGGRVAFCCAGGGFAYVGAIHDSFPVAYELSRKGYNTFAIIYRPGAQTACEDLSNAIAYVQNHADELGVTLNDYSIWGGSAGARMANWVGTYTTEFFTGEMCPRPSAVITQYTGLNEVTGEEPPTYACVGTRDYIADWRVMSDRIARIKANGTPAEIEVFPGLSHGFGLGTGTVAQGWLDRAAKFWDEQSN